MKAWLGGFAIFALLAGCGGGANKPPPTPQCLLPSDCTGLLSCVQSYCVSACDKSKDCLYGERCIKTDEGNYCQPLEKATCALNSDCTTPLVCGIDLKCRNQCLEDRDCLTNQVCTTVTKLCADPSIDKNYDPVTNDFKTPDGGFGGTGGSSTGGRGGGGGGGGGSTGGMGGRGGGPISCPNAQTQFGDVAQGDANPNFTSGVGVRNASTFFIFSGYSGPVPGDGGTDPDAAVVTGNVVYVQAFDAATAAKRGAAVPLLSTTDGPNFAVFDVSIAPTGEIALLYSHASTSDGRQSALFVSFLGPTSADAGAPGLEVKKTQQLETAYLGQPHVVWSVANQAFVMSWKYLTTTWFTRIRTFSPNGSSAGGISVVPNAYGSDNDHAWEDARVATSGQLFGVIHRNPPDGHPMLTMLDLTFQQVGGFIELGTPNINWAALGGTTGGFLGLYGVGAATVFGTFVPTSGSGNVLADAGAPVDGGDAGAASLVTFSFPSNASVGQAISDDTGGAGGMGAVLLESNGANFLYVTADGSKHFVVGTVLPSANGAEVSIANYHGSFSVSLYDRVLHSTQMVASGCP